MASRYTEQRWYPRLVPKDGYGAALLDTETGGLIVCHQLEQRRYTRFASFIEYFKYIQKIRFEQQCFYEVIIGSQKPYFDCDVVRVPDPTDEVIMPITQRPPGETADINFIMPQPPEVKASSTSSISSSSSSSVESGRYRNVHGYHPTTRLVDSKSRPKDDSVFDLLQNRSGAPDSGETKVDAEVTILEAPKNQDVYSASETVTIIDSKKQESTTGTEVTIVGTERKEHRVQSQREIDEALFKAFENKSSIDITHARQRSTEPSKLSLTMKQCTLAIEQLILAIKHVLPQITDNNILIFTSHSDTKLSFHIVIDGWFFADYMDNKGFHDAVVKYMSSEFKAITTSGNTFRPEDIIDHTMYKSIQQFRIVGSHKWNDIRVKTISKSCSWRPPVTVNSEDQYKMMLLAGSLVCNTTACRILPTFQTARAHRAIAAADDVSDDISKQAFALLNTIFRGHIPFEIRDVTGSIVNLKRLSQSMCPVCNRPHEHENPYLLIVGSAVYYSCRRSENKKYLGDVGTRVTVRDSDAEDDGALTVLSASAAKGLTPIESLFETDDPKTEVKTEVKVKTEAKAKIEVKEPKIEVKKVATSRIYRPPIITPTILNPVDLCRSLNVLSATKAAKFDSKDVSRRQVRNIMKQFKPNRKL